jgi:phage baseplate assembly protein W
MKTLELLGRGAPFPLMPDRDGRIEYLAGAEKVQQALRILLDTDPGERVMRPAFGCGLRRYLMQPNSAATRALIRQDVQRAIAQWERRIDVQSIDVLPAENEPTRVDISIQYVHVRDRRPGNLVYPFYLE